VLSLTECHSCQEPISGPLMQESRFSVPDTFGAIPGPQHAGGAGRAAHADGDLVERDVLDVTYPTARCGHRIAQFEIIDI
jgi:hypothetical protein